LEEFLQTGADNVQIGAQGLSLASQAKPETPAAPPRPPAPAQPQRSVPAQPPEPGADGAHDVDEPRKPRSTASQVSNAARFATAPNRGLKPSQIVGLAQQIEYQGMKLNVVSGTYSGTHQVDNYLLLADGSIRKGWPKDVPLEDFDAAASQHAEPQVWGTYKARVTPGEGGFYDVVWQDGASEKLSLSFVLLAKSDERLNGYFYSIGTATAGVPGSATFADGWRGILFKPDGRFQTSQGGGADYDSSTATVTTSQRESAQGRYRLAGSVLELRYDDGRGVRQQFAFSSAAKDWIYLNGQRLLLRK
jgi:hypothetical protein